MLIQHFARGKWLTSHHNNKANKCIREHLFKHHASFGNQLRLSSSKKPFGEGTKQTKNIMEAPKFDLNLRGNSVLHQKAARATELHAELNALLDKQAKRQADELNRPFGAGFIEFVKRSKSEMINIFAAFVCVVLAYQIAVIRRGAKNLVDRAEEREMKVEELKSVLRKMSSSKFGDHLAKTCSEALLNGSIHSSETTASEEGIFSRWFKRRNIEKIKSSSKEDIDSMISNILSVEFQKTIGDIALTNAEMSEKRMKNLQAEMGIREEKRKNIDKSLKRAHATIDGVSQKLNEPLSGMEELLAEAQISLEADSDQVVVKTKKGFI